MLRLSEGTDTEELTSTLVRLGFQGLEELLEAEVGELLDYGRRTGRASSPPQSHRCALPRRRPLPVHLAGCAPVLCSRQAL